MHKVFMVKRFVTRGVYTIDDANTLKLTTTSSRHPVHLIKIIFSFLRKSCTGAMFAYHYYYNSNLLPLPILR